MDIRKVAVLGAGAVGSYVIWGLSARRDIELGVVADGPRGERLAKDGCAIRQGLPSGGLDARAGP